MIGKLVVIEGLDGAGKATQTRLLLKKLKKEKYQTIIFDFPQYHKFFGKLIGAYLRGEFGGAEEVSPYFASIFYAFDRWSVVEEIKKALNEGKIVLANRYSTANFLHQSGKIKKQKKRIQFLRWLECLEFDFLKIPKPDLVFFLNMPPCLGQKLVKNKAPRTYLKKKKQDIHEKSNKHLNTAKKQAPHLIKKYHWQKINCSRGGRVLSRQEVTQKIWEKMVKMLIKK